MSKVATVLAPGVVQEYNCFCRRKSKILKRWKDAKISILPQVGDPPFQVVDDFDVKDIKYLFTLEHCNNYDVLVEFIDDDQHDPNKFLGITVKCNQERSTTTLRMKDIAQQRWLMACLGATGRGLFSPMLRVEERRIENQWTGTWDITREVNHSQTGGDMSNAISQSLHSNQESPNYSDELSIYMRVPSYLTEQQERKMLDEPLRMLQEGIAITNRHKHDIFLPPIGPPVNMLISIGFGSEVGLDLGVQELWNPVKKFRTFIDHNHQRTFFVDPRAAKQPPVNMQCRQLVYGPDRLDESILRGNESIQTVIHHVNSAVGKKGRWGAWIIAKGINGIHGESGQIGMTGPTGFPGSRGSSGNCGGPGGPGEQGYPGTDAFPGTCGTNASDLSLYLSGDCENLRILGSIEDCVNLGGCNSEYIMCVDCTGGNGGNGGNGGKGGKGGSGGGGGHGGSSRGENSSGGDGGSGGQGGPGGYGGSGGDAGSSGNGGHCIIHSIDPYLLHLVEVAVDAGEPGKGGKPGLGGEGGVGGPGGYGGSGGSRGSENPSKSSGFSGRTGFSGPPGPEGPAGAEGINGIKGRNGGLSFVLLSPDGSTVLEESGYRYHVEVHSQSLSIHSAVDDGIFEPNEQITIDRFTLQNIGSMTLPEGSVVSMVSTPTIKFHPTTFKLPVLEPQQSMDITQEYIGRVFDVSPPNSQGSYLGEAFFETRVDLLGRPFDSAKTIHKLTVQYPVKIDSVIVPENMGRGEKASIHVTIANISKLHYGNHPGSGGEVALRIHFDKRVLPFSIVTEDSDCPYKIQYNPNVPDSFFVDVIQVPSVGKVTVTFNVAVSNSAELFDRCPIQVDLLLRGKLIEYHQRIIRVIAFYIPSQPPADILFVTDRSVTRKEFILWQKLFELLGARVDFWDLIRFNGFSYRAGSCVRHDISWVGRHTGSLILFPNLPFKYFDPVDVVTHLSDNSREGDANFVTNDSAVLFMSEGQVLGKIRKFLRHACLQTPKITIDGKNYGGNHIVSPDVKVFAEKRHEIIKNLESESPFSRHYITNCETIPKRIKKLSFSYGTLDVHRCPIHPGAKFMIVSRAVNRFTLDDPHFSVGQNEIPLGSDWGQTFLYVLYGLPCSLKFSILQGNRDEEVSATFVTPSGLILHIVELVELSLTKEIIAEISCLTIDLPKLAALTASILGDLDKFIKNCANVFSIIISIKEYAKDSLPKKHEDVKRRVLDYFNQIKDKLIEFGGKPAREQFKKSKSLSKHICFDNLINSEHTFEPHNYNLNKMNND